MPRKIVGVCGETVKVPSSRVESHSDHDDSTEVRRVYGAKVGVLVRGAKKVIIRPRLPTDPPGLVPYIVISGEHYTSGDAWNDARNRL
jgi:hypothetical protein